MTSRLLILTATAAIAATSCSEKPEPERVATLAGNYGTVATCITLGWSTLGKAKLQFDHPNREGLIEFDQGSPDGRATVEALVRQVSDRRVRVESRLPADPIVPRSSELWDTVEGCAAA